MKRLRLPSTLILCLLSACSTAKPTPRDGWQNSIAKAHNTSFEIAYSLGGHGEHRLTGQYGGDGQPHVATYLEREVVEEASINAESYDRFLNKVVLFIQRPQRAPSQEHDCRSPYSITLKIEGKTLTSKGCRIGDDGAFAKLVREGEFLLYSKK